jgi:hypothetical protein
MTEEDKALAVQFTKLSRIDSAAATQMLRWLRTNQDPNANYCLTCSDSIRYLHARVCAVWEQWQLDNPEKPKRNGKKNSNG